MLHCALLWKLLLLLLNTRRQVMMHVFWEAMPPLKSETVKCTPSLRGEAGFGIRQFMKMWDEESTLLQEEIELSTWIYLIQKYCGIKDADHPEVKALFRVYSQKQARVNFKNIFSGVAKSLCRGTIEKAALLWVMVNADMDDAVSKDEIKAFLLQHERDVGTQAGQILSAFKELDKDGSGDISIDEVKVTIRQNPGIEEYFERLLHAL